MFSNKLTQEQHEEISTPTVQENIDWSKVIANAKSEVDEVLNGEYHEDNDNAQYMWEEVMETVFGKDFFKWYNKNT
jgi:hypothetical protein